MDTTACTETSCHLVEGVCIGTLGLVEGTCGAQLTGVAFTNKVAALFLFASTVRLHQHLGKFNIFNWVGWCNGLGLSWLDAAAAARASVRFRPGSRPV